MRKYLIILGLLIIAGLWGETLTCIHSESLGGLVAVKISQPNSCAPPRFESGYPIFVMAQGGWNSGSFPAPGSPLYDNGFVWVSHLFPGDTMAGFHTHGIYDTRGINCINAFKDVLRFARGRIPDTSGTYIYEMLDYWRPDTTNVGVLALSNGGNHIITTLGYHAAELARCIDYIVGYENPTSPQTSVPDLGFGDNFPDLDGDGNGIGDDDYKNPHVIAYGETLCAVDYSSIALDTLYYEVRFGDTLWGKVFLDGNGNGIYDVVMIDSIITPDTDGNGIIDLDEDFPLSYITEVSTGLRNYSTPATIALWESIHTEFWPPSFASPAQADSFWWYRSAVYHYDSMARYNPQLAMMEIFTERDHVQATDDKVHVRHAYDGFMRNGLWIRFNPDSAYMIFTGADPAWADHPVWAHPFTWDRMISWSIGEDVGITESALAGLMEMADRTHFGVWDDPDLDRTLRQRPASVAPIFANMIMHNEEPPGDPAWHADSFEFAHNRGWLLLYARMLARKGVSLNWQCDWNFASAVADFDRGEGTGGLNIVEYMHDSLGHEIDPHAHETRYNYADVAWFIEQCGVTPSNVAGGFIAMPRESSVMEHLLHPIEADSFDYTWQADILWGGATSMHVGEESLWIAGIWKPMSPDSFYTHDDGAPVPHVGRYKNNWAGVRELIELAIGRVLSPDSMYTCGVFYGQAGLTAMTLGDCDTAIDGLQEYRNTDHLRFVTIGQAVDIWRADYDSAGTMLWWDTTAISEPHNNTNAVPDAYAVLAYPNPFNDACNIVTGNAGLLEIFDCNGRCVFRRPLGAKAEGHHVIWQPTGTVSGVYLVRIHTGTACAETKVVYVR